jgi:hypothetical protein
MRREEHSANLPRGQHCFQCGDVQAFTAARLPVLTIAVPAAFVDI